MTKGVQDRMAAVARVRDGFHAAIFRDADVDAAAGLATDDCSLELFPSGRGARGVDELRRYLAADLVPHLPADLAFRSVSRTGDRWRFFAEDVVTFTHDRELPWLLPSVAPTSRSVQVLAVSVATVTVVSAGRSAVGSYRMLWDYGGLLTQLGLERVAVGGA